MTILSSKKLIWTLVAVFVVAVPMTVILARSIAPSALRLIGDSSNPVSTGWFGVAIKGYDTVIPEFCTSRGLPYARFRL